MDLLQEIEKQVIPEDKLYIYSIGQSGYVLKTYDSTIYIDPYLSDYIENPNGINDQYMCRRYPPPFDPEMITNCDAIICTHAHVDHMDPWTINRINTNFQLYSSIGAFEKSNINFSGLRTTFLSPQETCQIKSFTVKPIPAAHYNLMDEKGQPDCLSIIVQWQEKLLFFWGDGIAYEGQYNLLSSLSFDCFFAPINGRDSFREKKGIIGNINGSELAEICSKLNIKRLIPNHYDMFKNNTGSVKPFQKEIKQKYPNQSVNVLECGDKIEL